MTISSTISRSGPYQGNGVTTSFDYDFRIVGATHITVVKTVDGEDTVVAPSAFSVSGVGSYEGGSITFTLPPATGEAITIIRNVPFTQETDLENQGAYYAETVERSLDLAAMRDQQLEERMDRAVIIPVGADPAGLPGLIEDLVRLRDSAENIDIVADNMATITDLAPHAPIITDHLEDITNFAKVYLGPKAADPTTRNDGSALVAGDLYFNSTVHQLRFYTGAGWQSVTDQSLNIAFKTFTGNGVQTTFALDETPDIAPNVIVSVGGVLKRPVVDYAVSGLNVTLSAAPGNGVAVDTWVISTTATVSIPPNGSITDLKVASPGDPAQLIHGNKIRYDDGIDPFPRPLVTRDRNWMWITDTDQITGNGSSNDQVGVERAVQKACQSGKKLLIPDNITIRLTAPVVNYNKLPLRIVGGGVEPYQNNNYNAGAVHARGAGSWFFLDHTGKGFHFTGRDNGANIVGATFIGVNGIGTFRTQPAPGVGWAPTNHDFDFEFVQCSADVDDLMLLNATKGLNWRRGRTGQLNIGKIRGQPLQTGIQITNAYDVVRIADVHFWRFWSLDANVASYMRSNANAIYSLRNDNPIFGNLFTFGYQRSIFVDQFAGNGPDEPAGTTYHASIDHLGSDQGQSAIVVSAASNGFTAQINNMYCEQSPEVAVNTGSIVMLGPNAKVHIGALVSNNTAAQAIVVGGVNSEAVISRLQPGIYNRSGVGFPAVEANAAGAVVRLNEVINLGSGGGAPLCAESGGGLVTGLRRQGLATVPNGGNGVNVAHGLGVTPRGIICTMNDAGGQGPGGVLPRVSAKDASIFVFDMGVAATANRPVAWEAFF